MCEAQMKLVAWLDGELSRDEAASVQRHVEGCRDCAGLLARYERVNKAFSGYRDAVAAEKTRSGVWKWVPVLSGAVAVATVLLFLVFSRAHTVPLTTIAPTKPAAAIPVVEAHGAAVSARKPIRKRRAVTPVQVQNAKWQPTETAVQIAIPVEAMFPPGAMPQGMNFIAELSIDADGFVKQVRLRQ
jgi:anti-sigma factor RsiW